MPKNTHINLAHGRPGKYSQLLEKISKAGVCPFCVKNLKLYHKKPILKKTNNWLLTTNQNPYQGLKSHWLLINNKHLTKLSDLKPADWLDLERLLKWLENKYTIPGGAFFIRFGDTNYTGASVTHLHAHLVFGGKRTKNKKENTTRLGYYK